MNDSSFEQRVARWRHDVLPLAARSIENVAREGREVLAGDAEALRLLALNFHDKSRLLALGTCYAAGLGNTDVPPLVETLVRWAALFTMIDTAIDEGRGHDRAECERLAGFLVEPASPPQSPLEAFLVRLRPPSVPPLDEALRPYLERHARLIIFQHIDVGERTAYLDQLHVGSYEALCVDGSPGPLFALVRAAAQLGPDFNAVSAAAATDALYFPEFGLLHVWVDDLADLQRDAATKDLNLAALAIADGKNPMQEFSNLLKTFIARISSVPSRNEVLFPLRLMIEEYQKQAEAAAPGGAMAVGLQGAAQFVRSAWLEYRS